MSSRGERLWSTAAVTAIVATAVGLRFWKLGWGLSQRLWFPDEVLLWRRHLMAFVSLTWSSFLPSSLAYPTLFGFLSGGTTGFAHLLGLIPAPGKDLLPAILIGRGVSAMAGVCTVGLVGWLAGRFYSRRAGLTAAALMAVVPLEAMQPRYLSSDVLLTTCTAATLLVSCVLAERGTAGWALAAGLCAGLGFAAKYNGIVLVVAPAWAALEAARRTRSARPLVALGTGVALGFAAGLSAGCPQCLLRSDLMLTAIRRHQLSNSVSYRSFSNNFLVPTLGWYGRPYLYQLVASLPYAMGWPLYALSILGVAWALARRAPSDRVVLVTLAAYLVVVGRSYLTFPRYLLPMLPGLVVLAGRVIAAGPGGARLRGAAFAAVCIYTLVLAASQVDRFSYDQQEQVAQWIERAWPAGGPSGGKPTVAYPDHVAHYVRLRPALRRRGFTQVATFEGHWFDGAPEVFVMPEWTAISIRRDRPASLAARDLDRLESGAAGYRPAARWRSEYLQESFYTWLDPAFAADLWQGELGFTVYVRDDLPVPR